MVEASAGGITRSFLHTPLKTGLSLRRLIDHSEIVWICLFISPARSRATFWPQIHSPDGRYLERTTRTSVNKLPAPTAWLCVSPIHRYLDSNL